jgi:CBS domain-containing protein
MYVSDWMTKKVFTVEPDDYLADAISIMREKQIKHLPVLKNGKLKASSRTGTSRSSAPQRLQPSTSTSFTTSLPKQRSRIS